MADNGKRVIIVTGGSRGIGRAICVAFAGNDTEVFFNYFSPGDPEGEKTAAAETEKMIAEAGGTGKGLWADIASRDETNAFFDQVLEEAGHIDVLVNNAGITKDALIVRMKEADWDAVLNVNLKGPFNCIQIIGKIMMKQRHGRIINIASIVGVTGNAGQANYVASKAGIIGLTKTAAKELAPRGVTVNAVAPGFIVTDMTAVVPEKAREAMLGQIPMGRPGQAEDIAGVVTFLASEQAAYITGQVIHVSGGMYM
ncbi:MAG: 3-oxoacyl-[acyl-carrier-protein] reductase [Desulfobacteraceae bacterium]|nr:3-oxoacyl-[acyl-carrier-protein] reductase [Desulfobacteraceae bacterium]